MRRHQVRMCSINQHYIKAFLLRNSYVLFTVGAVVVGVILGFTVRPYNLSLKEIKYLSFPGEILMRMLRMIVLPLIVSSLVSGISQLDTKATGKMGLRAIIYYIVTTLIAVFIGIVLVTSIRPGTGKRETPKSSAGAESVTTTDAFLDLIRNMVPSNLVEACFKQYKTHYKKIVWTKNITVMVNESVPQTNQETVEEMIPVSGSADGMNTLGLVVFSLLFGLVIGKLKQQGQPLKNFFNCLNDAIMSLVAIIMWYAPVGILFLIAGKILEMKDLLEVGGQLGMYMVCVIAGLFIHSVIVLPLLFYLGTRRNPFIFISGLLQALITAFGTSSSSATLPITFHCLEENNHVDKRVTRLVLPVGTTINMDGTALYEAVAAIFIAQVNDMALNFGQILTIGITATAASIGAAAIPQAGLVTMVMVLTSVGLPTEDISLIVAVDWFLDRIRTTTNVLGDSIGAGIVEYLSRKELQNTDPGTRSSVTEVNYQEDDCLGHQNNKTAV
ncbi:excitatory amino acid transporter 1-like [Tachysurus vachellii]|nr:excitatory amino acid transporter 1-like [Tachysurus vachellii]